MKDGGAFDLPAPEARREMLAEEVDLVARQDRLLKMALKAAAALSVATLAMAGLAGWALTKERVHVYLAERDPAGTLHVIDVDGTRNPDDAVIMAEIEHWLRKAREVTPAPPVNERMRGEAVAATKARSEDKDRLFAEAREELKLMGEHTVRVVEDLEFYPLTDDRRTWRLLWTEKTTDLRDMAIRQTPMRAQLTVAVEDPHPDETLSGIRIVPPTIEERRR
jgi:type IV secretory pathway TrbF-like protein